MAESQIFGGAQLLEPSGRVVWQIFFFVSVRVKTGYGSKTDLTEDVWKCNVFNTSSSYRQINWTIGELIFRKFFWKFPFEEIKNRNNGYFHVGPTKSRVFRNYAVAYGPGQGRGKCREVKTLWTYVSPIQATQSMDHATVSAMLNSVKFQTNCCVVLAILATRSSNVASV